MVPAASPKTRETLAHFLPAVNNTAPDELHAHTGMFGANTNDGYYKLGLDTAGVIREAVMIGRGVVAPELTKQAAETATQVEGEADGSDANNAMNLNSESQHEQ
jgi:hypothetical protein